MDTQINKHHIYSDPRFITEREILTRLTEICGFDTTIGVIDYYHDSPTLEIGIVDESKNTPGQMPSFKENTRINIALIKMAKDGDNPLELPAHICFDALQKIVVPLVTHWMEVAKFLIEYYQGELGKEMCIEGYRKWEKQ